MNTRIAGIALLVIGVAITVAGLGVRVFLSEDDGHHDGRTPTFAAADAAGADALLTELDDGPDGNELTVWLERGGQVVTDYEELHDATGRVFVASEGLDWYGEAPIVDGDGRASVDLPGDGTYRVVLQAAPSGGPDLLELGTTVVVGDGSGDGPAAAGQPIVDDEWVGDGLTIERRGLDFVLSGDFDGPDTAAAPAFLVLFHADDLRFAHAHAELVGSDRFRFAADLPARGQYLAALQFVRGDQPITALFHLSI